MNNDHKTPYATLNPDLILDAVESIGLRCSGSLLALNSYENRVYQIGIEDDLPLIAKFYRPNRWSDDAILEEHQFSIELADRDIQVIPPLVIADKTLHHYHDFRFALFPRQGGRPFELGNLDQLEWMGRFIGRLHAVGAMKPFMHRQQLTPETHGFIPYKFLLENNFIPDYLKNNYCLTVDALLKKVEQCFQRVGAVNYIRLHGDFHAGNVLWNEVGPRIVDLDDSLMGPAVQDLWMLLSGNDVALEIDTLLENYSEFFDFDYRELHLIEALRALRMIYYSGWLAKRWDDPAFPMSFPWFNTPRYWQDQVQHLGEQVNILDEVLDKI